MSCPVQMSGTAEGPLIAAVGGGHVFPMVWVWQESFAMAQIVDLSYLWLMISGNLSMAICWFLFLLFKNQPCFLVHLTHSIHLYFFLLEVFHTYFIFFYFLFFFLSSYVSHTYFIFFLLISLLRPLAN